MNLEFSIALIGTLGLATLIQLYYYLYFILKTKSYVVPEIIETPPLSVVICAKNEATNLEKHIPLLMQQDYPSFQVVVVDDCSTDGTDMVLAQLKKQYTNLYYTTIPTDKKFHLGKKLALTIGIKAAKHEFIVLTDADCYPNSTSWLQQMSQGFNHDKQIIIGHGAFEKKPKSLFNLFLRYEAFFNAVQYFGFAMRGLPFMAVGRNMAYKKGLFTGSNVYKKHLTLESGDDDLFMITCANKDNTTVVLHPESQTISIAPANLGEWITRKSRHLTTSVHYPFKIKFWLGIEPLTRIIIWSLTFCSVFFNIFAPIAISLFFIRILTQYFILANAAKKMGEGKLHVAGLLFDAIIPIIIGSIWLLNIFSANKKKWK